MIAAKPQEEFVTWTAPGRFRSIVYAAPLMHALAREAVEGYELRPGGGIEIGGILFGTIDPDQIRITASRPVLCQHEYGPQFRLSSADERGLRERLSASLEDPALAGLIPVGWYHSHTRSPIELTHEDVRLWDTHFSQPWQVALVLRPEDGEPTRAGFFFRPEGGGAVQTERSYKVFEADPSPATSYEALHRLAVAVRTPDGETAAADAAPPAPSLPDELFWQPEKPGLLQRLRWPLGALAVAILAGAAWMNFRPVVASKPMPHLGLRVISEEGQLKAVWNKHVSVIESARGGTIEIVRGGEKTVLPLSPILLKSGSLPIPLAQNEIKVRLEVDSADPEAADGPVFEVAQYIGSPLARYAPPSPETTRLRDEVVQAESKLMEQASINNKLAGEIEDLKGAAKKQADTARDESKKREELAKAAIDPKKAEDDRKAAEARKAEDARRIEETRKAEEARKLEQTRKEEEERLARERQQKQAAAAPPVVAQAPPPPAAATPAPAPAPVVAAYTGPRSGKLIWTGFLGAGASLSIDGRRASVGSLNGSLPGVPVRISVYPAEFAAGGLSVYSGAARHQGDVEEGRSAQNGWLNTKYKYDPDRARGVSLAASPTAQSGHRQMVVRAGERPLSAIVIEWEVAK